MYLNILILKKSILFFFLFSLLNDLFYLIGHFLGMHIYSYFSCAYLVCMEWFTSIFKMLMTVFFYFYLFLSGCMRRPIGEFDPQKLSQWLLIKIFLVIHDFPVHCFIVTVKIVKHIQGIPLVLCKQNAPNARLKL